MSSEYKGFFQKREDISKKISDLDKEIFRLNSQREKLEEGRTSTRTITCGGGMN